MTKSNLTVTMGSLTRDPRKARSTDFAIHIDPPYYFFLGPRTVRLSVGRDQLFGSWILAINFIRYSRWEIFKYNCFRWHNLTFLENLVWQCVALYRIPSRKSDIFSSWIQSQKSSIENFSWSEKCWSFSSDNLDDFRLSESLQTQT